MQKILQQILANQIPQHIKTIIYIIIRWNLFFKYKDGSTYKKSINVIKHINIMSEQLHDHLN